MNEMNLSQFLNDREKARAATSGDTKQKWVLKSIEAQSDHAGFYRALAPDLDIEDDIVEFAKSFKMDAVASKQEQACDRYNLRLIWRFLKRRHAHSAAAEIALTLQGYEESWFWRFNRLKEWFLPRLFLAVLAGFLLLSSSSGLFDLCKALAASTLPLSRWLFAGTGVAVTILAFVEVQHCVGRAPIRRILKRALRVVCTGFAYGAIGAILLYYTSCAIFTCHQLSAEASALCGAAAVLLGFVFQVFWPNQSTVDPL